MLLKPKNLKSNVNFSMSWITHHIIIMFIIYPQATQTQHLTVDSIDKHIW